MPIRILGLIVCLLPLAPMAQAADLKTSADMPEPFPGYHSRCPLPMVWSLTPQLAEASHDDTGQPVIILDKTLARPENAFHLAYLAAHECAHHILGHVTAEALALRKTDRRAVLDQELSADCMATEMLIQHDQATIVNIMLERFQRSGYYSPGRGYPSGLQRAQIVLQCANAQKAAMALDTPTSD